jgi:AraC-like DNA-binding protein
MRRAFLRTVGIPPGQYRERFNRPSPPTNSPNDVSSQLRRSS